MVVARALLIGVKTTAALAPYHFLKPPTVHAEGYCSINDIEDTDMRFTVAGGPFEWWKFKLPLGDQRRHPLDGQFDDPDERAGAILHGQRPGLGHF